jgi:hypothetical protein
MGFLSWIKVGGVSEARPRNDAEEEIRNALVKVSLAVGAMGKSDPSSHEWPKLCRDFEKAATGMESAIRRYDREWRKDGPRR